MKPLRKKIEPFFPLVKRLGFDDVETRLYLAILYLGKATMHQAASEAGLNRAASYAVAERLKQKGAINEVKKNGKTLVAGVDPRKVLHILQENLTLIDKRLGDLNALIQTAAHEPGVVVYEGRGGLKTVQTMILEEAKSIDIFGDGDAFKKLIPNWAELYIKQRKAKGIKSRILLKGTPAAIESARRNSQMVKNITSLRLLPPSYSIVGGFDVYNNKVVIYSFEEKNLAIVIESSIIATLVRTIFEILWKSAEPYSPVLFGKR